MSTVANSEASSLEPEEINSVMADCVALEQLRVFRQLLVLRCGVIAATIAVGGLLLGLLHSLAYWFSMSIFVLAPAGAWMVEHRHERVLRKKVVKSS